MKMLKKGMIIIKHNQEVKHLKLNKKRTTAMVPIK